jgi:osmoprotectant transport system permease protein
VGIHRRVAGVLQPYRRAHAQRRSHLRPGERTRREKGLVWLTPSKFSNTYALGLPKQVAEAYPQINTISDLNQVLRDEHQAPHLVALDTEFANRPTAWSAWQAVRPALTAQHPPDGRGLVYTAMRNNQVFAGLVYTTDGRLNAFNLKLLEDDKHYFPDYTAAPVVRQAVLDAHPQLAALLKPLAEQLDDETMRQLNAKVDVEHQNPTVVAADFLRAPTQRGTAMNLLDTFAHLDWAQVLQLTWQHITLVGIAVGLAILVGVPLGILMTRFPTLAGPLQASATVLLTIPSIALFGLLLPFYSKFGQGLGPLPAITAVFLYSLLPIMRNTYLALTNVEPGIREAARGIGMTFGQRLRMVELPIAVPVILAGVRTAVVMNIGVMTIAATIGAGGLGVLILTSISRSDMSMLLVGAVLVSLLAIFADLLLQTLQRALTPEGLRS